MVGRKMSIKFALDPCSGSEKSEITDEGRKDGHMGHDSSSADKSPAELRMYILAPDSQ